MQGRIFVIAHLVTRDRRAEVYHFALCKISKHAAILPHSYMYKKSTKEIKATKKESGNIGEQEIVNIIPCPNCGKKLMMLPPNYPLYDVQCTGCSFRAQVKTNQSKPKSTVFGAGWQIMSKVLKSGYMTPPLFLNFKWFEKETGKQEIRFYPFVPKKNLSNYKLSETARRANYEMFTYIGMDKLPYFLLYQK